MATTPQNSQSPKRRKTFGAKTLVTASCSKGSLDLYWNAGYGDRGPVALAAGGVTSKGFYAYKEKEIKVWVYAGANGATWNLAPAF